jgi:hypothetical protein
LFRKKASVITVNLSSANNSTELTSKIKERFDEAGMNTQRLFLGSTGALWYTRSGKDNAALNE